ncbi:MAG: ABC transporter permease, partial [Spirochaetaceae bacterium]|nr:ABC transporter permease [Spirochaetaceae bacterium]
MVRGALFRQKGKMLMVALTVALGASLATAMLNVMFDVGDKVNQELKTYGANINVLPRGASLLDDLYGVSDGEGVSDKYLKESELGNIKTIFWAFNIVDFTPYLKSRAQLIKPAAATAVSAGEGEVRLVGAWFNQHLELPTGESVDTGMRNMKSWWDTQGRWLNDEDKNALMAGETAARKFGLEIGDTVVLQTGTNSGEFTVAGIFSAGGSEDEEFYLPLASVQSLADK